MFNKETYINNKTNYNQPHLMSVKIHFLEYKYILLLNGTDINPRDYYESYHSQSLLYLILN